MATEPLTGSKYAPMIRLNAEDGSIAIYGENGTGSDYRAPANNLGVYVANSGNVGIGTTAPLDKIDVQSINFSSSQDGGISIKANGGIANGIWQTRYTLKSNSGGVPRVGIDFVTRDYSTGAVASNVEAISIIASGNVGIGTTSPGYTLDVQGTIGSTSDISSNSGNFAISNGHDLVLKGRTGGNGRALVDMGGTLYLNYDNDFTGGVYTQGNFSAGGSIAAPTLCISSDCRTAWPTSGSSGVSGSGTSGRLALWSSSTALTNSTIRDTGSQIGIGTTPSIDLAVGDSDTGLEQVSDGELAIYTDNTSRVRIDNSGNVGIGDSTPDSKLDVDGKVTVNQTGNYWAINAESASASDDEGAVYGEATTTGSHNTVGVWGVVNASGTAFGQPIGVRGDSKSSSTSAGSVGVLGYNWSTTGSGGGAGVWGGSVGTPGSEGPFSAEGHGVMGETYSTSTGSSGVFAVSRASTGTNFGVYGQTTSTSGYGVFSAGPSGATGYKSAIVPVSTGAVELYATESPEIWFEDIKEGQLVDGKVIINLDPLFLETVTINDQYPMQVYIQMYDSSQVFVKRNQDSFEVIEMNNGTSNAKFTYRIMAKRRGYEDRRLQAVDPAILQSLAKNSFSPLNNNSLNE